MKKSILLMMMIGVIFLGTACGAGAKYADYGMKTLMEASTADWVKSRKLWTKMKRKWSGE